MFVGQRIAQQAAQGSQPPGGGFTVNGNVHEATFPAQSVMVIVTDVTPGPTIVPGGGDCAQDLTQQSSL